MSLPLAQADPEIAALDHQTLRQPEGLEMIASGVEAGRGEAG